LASIKSRHLGYTHTDLGLNSSQKVLMPNPELIFISCVALLMLAGAPGFTRVESHPQHKIWLIELPIVDTLNDPIAISLCLGLF